VYINQFWQISGRLERDQTTTACKRGSIEAWLSCCVSMLEGVEDPNDEDMTYTEQANDAHTWIESLKRLEPGDTDLGSKEREGRKKEKIQDKRRGE
jgi:hypothetical protein